jgi:hypothetical protein
LFGLIGKQKIKMNYISLFDVILVPFYLIIIYLFAYKKKTKHITSNSYYKYYVRGLTVKIIGGLGLCVIYLFYYKGGDTVNYFDSDISMLKLLGKNPIAFFDIIIKGNKTYEQYSFFDSHTGWPLYWRDYNSFFLIRLTSLLVLFSFKSYLVTTILLAWISYSGIWRLYTVFCSEFPAISNNLAIAFLMIPSVAFWGSGLLKDTVTYSACCWFTYGFYKGIINKKQIVLNSTIILIATYLILSIKPYILYSLLPGAALWIVSSFTANVKSSFVKIIAFPLFSVVFLGGTYLIFQKISVNLGKWSVNEVLERAVITQNDLVKDYYGGNTFDIGSFDATLPSIIAKAPVAILAGLYRPFIWEARNPVMLLSGLENTFFVIMSIYLLIKLKVYNIITIARENPLLLYSLVFSFFFAFMVGLTTPNFGSLVRYRIPAIPFFVASLFILKHYYEKKNLLKNTA